MKLAHLTLKYAQNTYNNLSNNEIVNELFDILLDKQEINREEMLKTFSKFNSYIVQYNDEKISKRMNTDIEQIVKAVNYAYKVSKSNFIWEEKVKSNKKNGEMAVPFMGLFHLQATKHHKFSLIKVKTLTLHYS